MIGASTDFGRITSGGTASSGVFDLYMWSGNGNNNTNTLNSRIVDNPNGARVRFVLNFRGDGNRSVTMTDGSNSYTGGTIVNTSATLSATSGVVFPNDAHGLDRSGDQQLDRDHEQYRGPDRLHLTSITTVGNSTLTLFGNNTLPA